MFLHAIESVFSFLFNGKKYLLLKWEHFKGVARLKKVKKIETKIFSSPPKKRILKSKAINVILILNTVFKKCFTFSTYPFINSNLCL